MAESEDFAGLRWPRHARQIRSSVERISRALERGDHLAVLAEMVAMRSIGDEVRDYAILTARRTGTATWQEIGETLGVERQVVWRKYRRQV